MGNLLSINYAIRRKVVKPKEEEKEEKEDDSTVAEETMVNKAMIAPIGGRGTLDPKQEDARRRFGI